MKKLLILGGSRYIIPVIEAAHELGIYVITCDYLPDNPAHKYSDEYRNISIIDEEAVLEGAKEMGIDGVTSFAADPGVVSAAYVAEKLGLPGCPYEPARILQSKERFRQFLKENGFNTPDFRYYETADEALAEASQLKLPVIVKPVDSAGSKGVTKVSDLSDYPAALEAAFAKSLGGRIIVEQFIEAEGYSSGSDCFSIGNDMVFTSFACQRFEKNGVNPYSPIGSIWPSVMPEEAQKELKDELQRLIKLLNTGTNVYNVEARLGTDGKPYIMECSPRGGGNRLCEVLKLACGQDIIMNHVRTCVGMEALPMTDPVYDGVWAEYVLHINESGILRSINIDAEFEKEHVKQKNIWFKPGDAVEAFESAAASMGTITLRFDSHEEAEHYLDNCHLWLDIELEDE